MSTTKTAPVQGTHMLIALVDAAGDYAGHETHLIGCGCSTRRDKVTGLKRTKTGFPINAAHPAWIARAVDGPCVHGD